MSDIFLSYAREDFKTAKQLASALEINGYAVWWDREIPAGRVFDEVIEEAIDESNCVVVLWSNHSTKSNWVKTEASEGERRNILIPVQIEDVELPLSFRRYNAANMIEWDGEATNNLFEELLLDINRVVKPKKSGSVTEVQLEDPAISTEITKTQDEPVKPQVEEIRELKKEQARLEAENEKLNKKHEGENSTANTSSKKRYSLIAMGILVPLLVVFLVLHEEIYRYIFLVSTGSQTVDNAIQSILNKEELTKNDLINLQSLNFKSGNISDNDMMALSSLPSLKGLNLSYSDITNGGLIHLKNLVNLQKLDLSGTTITDISNLQFVTELEELELYASKITNDGLANIRYLTKLKVLKLNKTGISNQGLKHLESLTSIEELDLDETLITDRGLEHLKSLVRLRIIRLGNTSLTGDGIKYFKSLTRLEKIDLSHTEVVDVVFEYLKPLTGLIELNIVGTSVTAVAYQKFKKQLQNKYPIKIEDEKKIPVTKPTAIKSTAIKPGVVATGKKVNLLLDKTNNTAK